MKIKKLVSAVSAFAMTVSAFAGMTVAKAATEHYTSTWSTLTNGTVTVSDLGTGWSVQNGKSANTTLTADNGVVSVYSGAKNNNNGYLSFLVGKQADLSNKIYRYSFDYKSNSGTKTGNNGSNIATCKADSVTNYSQFGSSINPNTIGATDTSTTYSLSVVVDNINKKAVYQVNGTDKYTDELTSANTGIIFRPGRDKTDYISNVVVSELTIPTLSVDGEAAVSVGSNVEIPVEVENGTVTVASSKDSVATATYADNKITINGVESGVANITVTAKGTDDYETVSSNIVVTVGDVEAADVIVNYVDENGTVISSDTTTYAAMTVGKSITEISYDDVIYGENCKYVKPVVTGLPLTVQSYDSETEENPNVITVTYERKEPVTNLTINYVYNEKVVATKTKTITDGYADDKFEFVDVFYLTGTDGVVYKTGKELYTTVANNANTTPTTDYNRTATLGTTLTVPVTVAENAVYFVEGEDLGVGSTTFDSGRTYMTASGNAVSGIGNKNTSLNVYTVPETAQYQIVIANYSRNRNSLLKLNDETIATIGNSNNGYRGQYSVINVNMLKDSVLSYAANGSSALTEVDYILIRKIGEYTPATATYSFVNDYTTETGETAADNASLFKLVVKAGTNAISSLNVKVNGTSAETAPEITTISGETEAVFAVVVNALSSSVESITAVINGDDVAATAAE